MLAILIILDCISKTYSKPFAIFSSPLEQYLCAESYSLSTSQITPLILSENLIDLCYWQSDSNNHIILSGSSGRIVIDAQTDSTCNPSIFYTLQAPNTSKPSQSFGFLRASHLDEQFLIIPLFNSHHSCAMGVPFNSIDNRAYNVPTLTNNTSIIKLFSLYYPSCASGSYWNGPSCNYCSIGYYCPEGVSDQIPCPPGFYNSYAGATICYTCEAGYYCPGESDKVACPSGANNYVLTSGATSLQGCYPPYTIKTMSTDLYICASQISIGSSIILKADNTSIDKSELTCYWYSGDQSQIVLSQSVNIAGLLLDLSTTPSNDCDDRQYTLRTASYLIESQIFSWSEKQSAISISSTPTPECVMDYSSSPLITSSFADINSKSQSFKIVSLSCKSGFYWNQNSNSSLCLICPVGYFCSGGLAYYQSCPPGSYYASNSFNCRICEAGYFCPGGHQKLACPSGTYGNTQGLASVGGCLECPAGYFCSGGNSSVSCPPGSFSITRLAVSILSCIKCQAGYSCPGGNVNSMCRVGYYSFQGAASCTAYTSSPSSEPSLTPSKSPTGQPSSSPTLAPSGQPSSQPTSEPTAQPTTIPTGQPSSTPSMQPSAQPSGHPSSSPSCQPSAAPSGQPSANPTSPTGQPTGQPSTQPSAQPSGYPSMQPSAQPSSKPSGQPTSNPTEKLFCIAYALSVSGNIPIEILEIVLPGALSYICNIVSAASIRDETSGAVSAICENALKLSNAHYTPLNTNTVKNSFKLAVSSNRIIVLDLVVPSPHSNFSNMELSFVDTLSSLDKSLDNGRFLDAVKKSAADTFTDITPYILDFAAVRPYYTKYPTGQPSSHPSSPPTGQPSQYPAPRVIEAIFDDNGAGFSITFDHSTDRGRILVGHWPCEKLFEFPGQSYTSCAWTSDNVVAVKLDYATNQLNLSTPILLRNEIPLRRKCSVFCDGHLSAHEQIFTIKAPLNPDSPTLILSVPAIISPCDDLRLDASSSSGYAGRPWAYLEWRVTGTGASDFFSIERMLNLHGKDISSPLVIPKYYLHEGEISFSLTAVNFFGISGAVSKQLYIDSSRNVPSLFIAGPEFLQIFASESLVLEGFGLPSSCADVPSLTFWWAIIKADGSTANIQSQSRNSRIFKVPSFTFETVSTNYTITLNALTSSDVFSASVTVLIKLGRVIARVLGAPVRDSIVNKDLIIDASVSFDQNFPATIQNLNYEWTCSLATGSICRNFDSNNHQTPTLLLPQDTFNSGDIVIINLIASANDGRSDATSVRVHIISWEDPLITLTDSSYTISNADSSVRVQAHVFGNFSCSVSWRSSSAELAVEDLALSPLTKDFSSSQCNINIPFFLNLRNSDLIGGSRYHFTITAASALGTIRSAEVEVYVREPPSSGLLVAYPIFGISFETDFLLSAPGWSTTSDGYPLRFDYRFSHVDLESAKLSIQLQATQTYVNTVLPSGIILLYLRVYDTYSASASASAQVACTPANTSNPSILQHLLEKKRNASAASDWSSVLRTVSYITMCVSFSATSKCVNKIDEKDAIISNMVTSVSELLLHTDASSLLLNSAIATLHTLLANDSEPAEDSIRSLTTVLLTLQSSIALTDEGIETISRSMELLSLYNSHVPLIVESFDLQMQLDKSSSAVLSQVLLQFAPGQFPLHFLTNDREYTFQNSLIADLSELQSSHTNSSSPISLKVNDGSFKTCKSLANGYIAYSLSQSVNSFFSVSGRLKSPVLRWHSVGYELKRDVSYDSNETFQAEDFLLRIPFESPQLLSSPAESILINRTIPQCADISAGELEPCDCTLITYTNLSATFSCSTASSLCPQPVSSKLLTVAESDSKILSADRQYGVLIVQTLANEVLEVFSAVTSDWTTASVVLSIVVFLLVIFFGGILYFSRWDALERSILLYASEAPANNEATKTQSYKTINSLRDRIEEMFTSGVTVGVSDLTSNDHDFERNESFDESNGLLKKGLRFFSCLSFPTILKSKLSLLKTEDSVIRFAQSLIKFHPFLWFLTGPSLARNRTIRFVTFFKSFIISLFTSTLIFGVYFPFEDSCSDNKSESTCLLRQSRLVYHQTECVWYSNFSGSPHCSLRPPPTDSSFILLIALITTALSLPLDLLLTILLLLVCNRKPNWTVLNFFQFSSYSNEKSKVDAAEIFYVDQLSISYVLNCLRRHKLLLAEGPQPSALQIAAYKRILTRLGIHIRNDSEALHLNLETRLFFSTITETVEYHVKSARVQGSRILSDIHSITDSVHDSYLLKETMLVHHFIYERIGFFASKLLQPHLDQYTRKIPILIHPIVWLLAWGFVISVCLFFIIWVLLWGFKNTGLTLQQWVVNFVLETIWGCLISSTARILFINIILISIIRPQVLNSVNFFCEIAADLDNECAHDGASYINQILSSVGYAANKLRKCDKNLQIVNILSKITDEDFESMHNRNYQQPEDVYKKLLHPSLLKQDSILNTNEKGSHV